MTWIDWAIIGVLGLSTLASLMRGFVKEALSLGAWVMAFLVATALSGRLSARLMEHIANDSVRYASTYVLLFVVTLVLGSLMARMMARSVKIVGLSGTDRILGTAFGLARGLVLVMGLLFVCRAVVPPEQQALRQSRLVPHLQVVEEWARRSLSDSVDRIPAG